MIPSVTAVAYPRISRSNGLFDFVYVIAVQAQFLTSNNTRTLFYVVKAWKIKFSTDNTRIYIIENTQFEAEDESLLAK